MNICVPLDLHNVLQNASGKVILKEEQELMLTERLFF